MQTHSGNWIGAIHRPSCGNLELDAAPVWTHRLGGHLLQESKLIEGKRELSRPEGQRTGQ